MATPNTNEKKPERSVPMPLIVVAVVVLLVGIGMLITNKAQRSDPTLTAAPPSGHPGQVFTASPQKTAKEQQIQARMNAQVSAMKASFNAPPRAAGGQPGYAVGQPGAVNQPGVPVPQGSAH